MQKFRQVWCVFVILIVAMYLGYQTIEHMKEDTSGPVFSFDETVLEVSIHDSESVLLEGITAKDKKDGDVTGSILVEKLSNLYDGNKRTVTYVAFDSDNHIAKMEREVVYTDYESPVFKLNGSLRYRVGETLNFDSIVSVWDCIDGDISNKVKMQMATTISNRTPAVYGIVYEVTNSAGETVKLPVQVEIYETNRNEIDINLTEYLVYYQGKEIDYSRYLKSVTSGTIEYLFVDEEDNDGEGISKERVMIRSEVNTKEPGVYPVYFYYENYGSIYTHGTEVMYVVVK